MNVTKNAEHRFVCDQKSVCERVHRGQSGLTLFTLNTIGKFDSVNNQSSSRPESQNMEYIYSLESIPSFPPSFPDDKRR